MTQHVKDTNASMAKAKCLHKGLQLMDKRVAAHQELAYSGEYAAEKPLDMF